MYSRRMSVLKIAREEQVSPTVVSCWLKKLGIEIGMGHHFVQQPPLEYDTDVLNLIAENIEKTVNIAQERIWGFNVSPTGLGQLEKFAKFVSLHKQGEGVKEISRAIQVHRSTIRMWRNGKDQPYVVKAMIEVANKKVPVGWKIMPLTIGSGGNEIRDWIEVPTEIRSYQDVVRVVEQLKPLQGTYGQTAAFGIQRDRLSEMRLDFFAYLLGFMLGDSGKGGVEPSRFTTMNLDLQLSQKEPSNKRLGDFVCFCANSIGVEMKRARDKAPTGATARSKQPTPAFRWISSRSSILAWMFYVCLGLKPKELTSINPVRMDWMHLTPNNFRRRFVQGVADSDGTTRRYVVEIASMPNAEFITGLLSGLGMTTARTKFENGAPSRSSVHCGDAASLPIFNEFVAGYRYQALMLNTGRAMPQ